MKHHRKSKFDPYIEDIKSLVSMGYTVRQVADELDIIMNDTTDESALYGFMVSREIRTQNYSGGKNRKYQAPQCNTCEGCFEVIGLNGNPTRMCYSSRLISGSVTTSPPWCPRRERQVG